MCIIPPCYPRLSNARPWLLSKTVQLALFYAQLLKVVASDAVIIISSSGAFFFVKAVPAMVVGKLLRKRVLLDFVGGGVEARMKRHPQVWRILLNMFDSVAVPTRYFKEVFEKNGIPCEICPHLVDLDRFSAKKSTPGTPTFLAIKNLTSISGMDTLIRAFGEVQKKYRGAVLHIVGNGPDRTRLEALASELKLSGVVFAGNISYSTMPAMFENATLFVHRSQFESFGIVLVEAFASGTPVVCSNVGGIPDIVTDGENGFLVPYGDYMKTAEKMITLMENGALYDKFRRNGLEEAKKYSWSVNVPKLIERLSR